MISSGLLEKPISLQWLATASYLRSIKKLTVSTRRAVSGNKKRRVVAKRPGSAAKEAV